MTCIRNIDVARGFRSSSHQLAMAHASVRNVIRKRVFITELNNKVRTMNQKRRLDIFERQSNVKLCEKNSMEMP